MNEVKSFLQSKMFWVGVSMIGTAVFEAIQSGGDLRTVALAGFGAIVIYVRKMTASGMDFSLPKKHCRSCEFCDDLDQCSNTNPDKDEAIDEWVEKYWDLKLIKFQKLLLRAQDGNQRRSRQCLWVYAKSATWCGHVFGCCG